MTAKSANQLVKRLRDAGIVAHARHDYSGRHMYGCKTSAIEVPDEDIVDKVESLSPVLRREARRDNLGKGWVWY